MGFLTAISPAANALLRQRDNFEKQGREAQHAGNTGRATRLFNKADRAERRAEKAERRFRQARSR